MRQEAAALREFNPGYDRLGPSFAVPGPLTPRQLSPQLLPYRQGGLPGEFGPGADLCNAASDKRLFNDLICGSEHPSWNIEAQ